MSAAEDDVMAPSVALSASSATVREPIPRRVQLGDRRLARRLHRGDPRALEELHERYGRAVFGLLLRALGNREDAEEVFQVVFTEAWRRGESYDPRRGSPLTWLLMTARTRAIDFQRRRVPEPVDPRDVAAAQADVTDVGPDLAAWRLAGLLERLPDRERQLLRLRFSEDLSQSQIAERTGLPLGTVKSRTNSALGRLRGWLEEEGE